MRKTHRFILTFAMALCSMAVLAQNGFNYQAVIRDGDGNLLVNQKIALRITLLNGDNSLYQERHTLTTNAYGAVSVVVGTGTILSGTSFANVPWSNGNISMRTEFNPDPDHSSTFDMIGTTLLQSVPFAEYAKTTGEVENPTNIKIQATATTGDEEALFEVKDNDGNVVFAVYKSGVRVYVDDTGTGNKAAKSGFAVTGRKAKDGEASTYFAVDNYGTQVYVDDEGSDKAAKAKFAVTSVKKGKDGDKAELENYLVVNKQGTQVYVDDEGSDKAAKAKFAVTSVKKGKDGETAELENYLVVNKQGTQVYVDGDEDTGKAAKAKFAVTSVKKGKATTEDNVFVINEEGTNVFVDDQSDGKAAKAKFAVTSVKKGKDGGSLSDNYLVVNDEGTKVYVDGDDNKAAKAKFAVTSVRSGKADEADDFFLINKDGTKVFIDEEAQGKAAKAKFAVTSVKKGKGDNGDNPDYLVVDSDSTRVYIDNANSKAAKSGFAVTGKKASKGSPADMLKVTQDSTRVYVTGGSAKSGFGVEGKDGGAAGGKNGFAVAEKSANGNAGYMDVTAENFFAGYNAGMLNNPTLFTETNPYAGVFSEWKGVNNTFVGNNAGQATTTGNDNVFVGNQAGFSNTIGINNVFMGSNAGYSTKPYSENYTYELDKETGKTVLAHRVDGSYNVFIGKDAGKGNTSGTNNVFLGEKAGFSNTLCDNNIFIGKDAGYNTTAGSKDLEWSIPGSTDPGGPMLYRGSFNMFIGAQSGFKNTTGFQNTFIGHMAGYSNTTGVNNVCIGFKAGSETTGSNNTFINSVSGYYTGSNNIIIGGGGYVCDDLLNGTVLSNGSIGSSGAIRDNAVAIGNLLLGKQSSADGAGQLVVNGTLRSSHIYPMKTSDYPSYDIGSTSARWNTVYAKSLNISYLITCGSIQPISSSTYNLGTSDLRWKNAFILYLNTSKVDCSLTPNKKDTYSIGSSSYKWKEVYATTFYGTVSGSSDIRLKKDVETLSGALEKVLKLRGISYYWKNAEELGSDSTHCQFDGRKHIGVIAQEIEAEFPELVNTDEDGFKSVEYANLTPVLIEAIKEQQQIINTLQSEKDAQQKEIEELKAQMKEILEKLK